MHAENNAAITAITSAEGPKPKLRKEDFKHNCSVFFKNLKALDTFSNDYKTMMANNLNTAAVVLQKIITKGIRLNTNIYEKINSGVILNLAGLNPESPVVKGFLTKNKREWNIENDLDDRKLLYDMLNELTATIDGGRRRSKKQKKQRRRTRRQK
jgi:hypothetical protein